MTETAPLLGGAVISNGHSVRDGGRGGEGWRVGGDGDW